MGVSQGLLFLLIEKLKKIWVWVFGVSTPTDGADEGVKAAACKSAYTAAQVARIVIGDITDDTNLSPQTTKALITQKQIFIRPPPSRFLHL